MVFSKFIRFAKQKTNFTAPKKTEKDRFHKSKWEVTESTMFEPLLLIALLDEL